MSQLRVVSSVLDAFHRNGIRYCHWKSNAHVAEGLCGETDLDLLVDRKQAREVGLILAAAGFRRFDSVFATRYPAIEDYIALDCDTGKLSHCHIHYRLVVGQAFLKGYRLPWEEMVLDTRQWRTDVGMFVAEPAVEMLLLIIRAALKLGTRDRLRRLVGRGGPEPSIIAEFEWLRQQVDHDRCVELSRRQLGEAAATMVGEILDRGLTGDRLVRFLRSANAKLTFLRIYGPIHSRVFRWLREMVWIEASIGARYLHRPRLRHRALPTGGLRVAFIGADGSGKSSLSRDVERVFSKKLDTVRIYFGSGDGSASLLRWPLRLLLAFIRRLGGPGARGNATRQTRGQTRAMFRLGDGVLALGRACWALALSLEKRQKLRAAWMASNRGMLVIADRYPQAQVMGLNDGPLLHRWLDHSNFLLRSLARWEAAPYEWADAHPPDLVIRLNVAPEAALARKPLMAPDDIQRRIAAIRSLTFRPPAVTVEVDANRPYDEVRRMVLKEIWEHM